MLTLAYLSSGLFLGWSLGANDAANVFGTAVGTRMLRFRTAALIASLFVILGAVVSGSGAAQTLGRLGAVDAIAGAFVVVLAAALTVFWMTRLQLPVSTSQAIVGAIIGWNLFAGVLTDTGTLLKIVLSWIMSLVLAAVFAFLIYRLIKRLNWLVKINLFRLDAYTRLGLILVGAFGAYSLGANNIANVMGVFVPINPFPALRIGPLILSSAQQLFLLGGIAIAVGIFTYSQRVMMTVGKGLFQMTPQAALVVVFSTSLVLFLFASQRLHDWLIGRGLPALPLVPVSSSQLIVGAIIGIAVATRASNIKYRILGRIILGWITTPPIAGLLTFCCLFIVQNVFDQAVYTKARRELNETVCRHYKREGIGLKLQNFEEHNLESFNSRELDSVKSCFQAELEE